jgi:hypothetical protein
MFGAGVEPAPCPRREGSRSLTLLPTSSNGSRRFAPFHTMYFFTPCISSHQQGTEPHAQRPPRGTAYKRSVLHTNKGRSRTHSDLHALKRQDAESRSTVRTLLTRCSNAAGAEQRALRRFHLYRTRVSFPRGVRSWRR